MEERSVLSGFSFLDFSTAGGLSIVGDAATTADNRLRLTPAAGGMEGAAWYNAEKQFVGHEFSTTFQFQMTENADPPGGSDGFVFAIQNTSTSYLSGGGGTLGYLGLPNSLVVEFDTFQNSEASDPSGSHISIHTNGAGANSWLESLSLGSYNTTPIMDDTAVHTAKIAYGGGTLSVYLDDLQAPKLSVSVDLANLLSLDAGRAWVGFTASTGGGWQNHDILNWSFDATVPGTTVNIQDASLVEGDSGVLNLVFAVTRSGDTSGATTVAWNTTDSTATASSGDYVAASGALVFDPGEVTKSVSIVVAGDTLLEAHESFSVLLTNAAGGTIIDDEAIGTILNDEVAISITDATAAEDGTALKFLDRFVSDGSGGLSRSRGLVLGPDSDGDGIDELYVSSSDTDEILRYSGANGAFLNAFVGAGSGGLDNPADLKFAADGYLYVSSAGNGKVLQFDGTTGAFLATIASGINPQGLTFADDGRLIIASQSTDEIFAYQNSVLSLLVGPGSGGLDAPRNAVFGSDGKLYVSNSGTKQILRYDGNSGAFIDVFASTSVGIFGNGPLWIEFGTDGYLYTTVRTNSSSFATTIARFATATGAFVDSLDRGHDGWSFTIGSDNVLYGAANGEGGFVDRIGPSSISPLTVRLNAASALPVAVSFATAGGSATSGSDFAGVSGTLTFAPGQTEKAILVHSLDDAQFEGDETFLVDLSNPSAGATVVDAQAVVTILDDDPLPTKFYVVNDASTNLTYEYAANGTAVENYALNAGNTTPRGAASTAAGDKLWVVDANRKVYVYDAAGGLLGSWTAGTLASNANVQGIATNGTDVWIVDAKTDKVFKYTGAATRLSGSQNAASSFSLNSGNGSSTDIVTDGASLWVTNNASQNKVFKYTLGGSLLGSWKIDASNTTPTGITIDPSNVSDVWIVDSGTDRVYRYAGAASRTSGSQAAAESFALAAGNTNPQGIADPPSPELRVRLPSEIAESDAPFVASWDGLRGQAGGIHEGIAAEQLALWVAVRRRPLDEQIGAIDAVFSADDDPRWQPDSRSPADSQLELGLTDQFFAKIGQ